MRGGKYEMSLCWILIGLAVCSLSSGQAHAQQPTDTGIDSIFIGGQSGAPATMATQTLSGQATGSQDGHSRVDAANAANVQEQNLPAVAESNRAASSSRNLDELPPDPPTEFQKLVQTSTGQMLSLYGARLFRGTPSTFAPVDKIPVPVGYVIGPGDELLIQSWGQVTLNSHLAVDRVGNIYLPQIGTVKVAGLPFADLQSYLKSQMSKVFRNFDLSVNMGELRSIQILVVGQARRPGSYTVSSLSTLVDALFVTGGPSPQGSLRDIQLKRAGNIIVHFDLYDLLERGDKSEDAPLLPGDIIYIPPVGAQVAVAGSVNAPAIYELKPLLTSTVAEALALAAGPTSVASNTRARLERVDLHSMRSIADLQLDRSGLSTALRDGDILELSAITDRYRNGVTLRGNVANPGRYDWKPGMRVGDLIPDTDSLITRDYWLRRGQLGEPILTYTPSPGGTSSIGLLPEGQRHPQGVSAARPQSNGPTGASQSTAVAEVGRSAGDFPPENDIVVSAPEIDWNYAVVERQNNETLVTSLLPFNLGKLVMEKDATQNIELQPGDVITIDDYPV